MANKKITLRESELRKEVMGLVKEALDAYRQAENPGEEMIREAVSKAVKKVLKEDAENADEYAAKINDGKRRADMLLKDFQAKCLNFLPYAMVNFTNIYEGVSAMVMEWAKNGVEQAYGDLKVGMVRECDSKILKEDEMSGPFYWSISEMDENAEQNISCVEDSATSDDAAQSEFQTPDEAYADGLKNLQEYTDSVYCVEVYYLIPGNGGDYVSGYYAVNDHGHVTEY